MGWVRVSFDWIHNQTQKRRTNNETESCVIVNERDWLLIMT